MRWRRGAGALWVAHEQRDPLLDVQQLLWLGGARAGEGDEALGFYDRC